MTQTTTDAADLTARLIRCPSVTPAEGGALQLLQAMLEPAGFECHRVDRNGTPNLFARWGAKDAARSFGFNGHTDVVPPGDPASWTHPPFSGVEVDGVIWGRGATDMKSGVAAFVAAAIDFVTQTPPDGAVILTITGDEEGAGKDGTTAILDWMDAQGEHMDVCVVAEPSNPSFMGEMIKIGRRGSITTKINATGVQGHAAYPHRANNPVHALLALLRHWTAQPIDEASEHFDASGLQVTSIDVGNPASNVIPEKAQAVVNIRFNDRHTGESVISRLQDDADRVQAETGVRFALDFDVSGESFLTEPGPFVDLVRDVVTDATGHTPALSTTGGTSDARFIKDHCPVLEFGLVGQFMHQVDERVPADQVRQLQSIFQSILQRYFA